MARVPKTSGSRTALEVAAAMQRVVDRVRPATRTPGETGGSGEVTLVLQDLATIMRGAKDLQAYQLEEVIEHVADLTGIPRSTAEHHGILPATAGDDVGSPDASGQDGQ